MEGEAMPCKVYSGTGAQTINGKTYTFPRCKGIGRVVVGKKQKPCTLCETKGKVSGKPCQTCNSRGWILP